MQLISIKSTIINYIKYYLKKSIIFLHKTKKHTKMFKGNEDIFFIVVFIYKLYYFLYDKTNKKKQQQKIKTKKILNNN